MSETNALTLLDCTLRDGGYYTDWHFDLDMVQRYVHLCAEVGIDMIELGYLRAQATQWGAFGNLPYAFPDELSDTFSLYPALRVALMLEFKEWGSLSVEAMLKVLDEQLKALPFQNVVLRIAVHFSQLAALEPYLPALFEKGMEVCINLMQVDLASGDELLACIQALEAYPKLKALYLADSLGSLQPARVSQLIQQFSGALPFAIGFHAHDNMGLALHNSLLAVNAGARWIDSTFYGMGRGAGNAKTEQLLPLLRPELLPAHCARLDAFCANDLRALHAQHHWGASPLYGLSGKMRIHPSYVQSLEKDSALGMDKKLNILLSLSQKNASSYSQKQLEAIMEPHV